MNGALLNGLAIPNGASAPLDTLAVLPHEKWLEQLLLEIQEGGRLGALFAAPESDRLEMFAVVARPKSKDFLVLRTPLRDSTPSSTPAYPPLQLFEREISEQYGVVFEGHPWHKPVRFHSSYSGKDAFGRDPSTPPRIGEMNYYSVEGTEIHEVAVGPVHAGVIEPGHFRFQCHGENVIFLEISLGYQHRGIEKMILGGPHPNTAHQMETIAGDTTVGHTTAWCRIVEGLSDTVVPARAVFLRAVALELERLANHAGDIGALAADVGFLPTSAFMGRIRGDYLNMQAELCGSRFGRALIRPGGLRIDPDAACIERVLKRLNDVTRDTLGAMDIFFDSPSCLARLERTGTVSLEAAAKLGLVGVAGRACGLDMDVRRDFPIAGLDEELQVPAVESDGDVLSRANVRRREIIASIDWLKQVLTRLPEGEVMAASKAPIPGRICVSAIEGWRGEVVHVAMTDKEGKYSRYKIVDPSFRNWSGLAMALREQQISDFPLCNKSFNLSYCGFDL